MRLGALLQLALVSSACTTSSGVVPSSSNVLAAQLCKEKCFNLVSNTNKQLCAHVPTNTWALNQVTCETDKNQRFYIRSNSQATNLVTLDDYCMGTENDSTNNGARIKAQVCGNWLNQAISILPDPRGSIRKKIKFNLSNKCLDVKEQSKDNGAELHQWDCYDDISSQLFNIVDVTNLPNVSGKVNLDIPIMVDRPFRVSIDTNQLNKAVAAFKPNPAIVGGDIYFVLVDTLRWDYVRNFAPTLSAFIDENLGGKGISGSTGTYHATPAIFNSEPSHFMRFNVYEKIPDPDNITDAEAPGTYWLRLLDKQGYNIYGIGVFFTCKNVKDETTWNRDLVSFFGATRPVLTNCKLGNDYSIPLRAKEDAGQYVDGDVMDKAIELATASRGNNLYLIYLYSTHLKYKWDASIDNTHSFVDYNTIQNDETAIVREGYERAIKTVDLEFKKLITFLKQKNRYDTSSIVVISDHGEALAEKPYGPIFAETSGFLGIDGRTMNHGNSLYREITEVPIAYKAPKVIMESHVNKIAAAHDSLFSPLDVAPTLLYGVGITDFDFDLAFGRSLFFGKPRHSNLASKAEFWGASRYMVLVNKDYKIYIRVDFDTLASLKTQNHFTVLDITDSDDQSVYDQGEFQRFGIRGNGIIMDPTGLQAYIRNNFADALSTLLEQ